MIVKAYEKSDFNDWKALRIALWPDASEEEHEEEMNIIVSGGVFEDELEWSVFFVHDDNELIGFIESSIKERLDDWEQGPLGYIEGWFVSEEYRGSGIGRLLIDRAEKWAKDKNCKWMASDVEFDNVNSLKAHQRMGYRIIGKNDESDILIKEI